MAGKYVVFFTEVYAAITEVRLYDETIEHIRAQHPEVPIELPAMLGAIENAVTRPTHIEASYPGTYVFVDERTTNRSGDPLRVPVKMIAGSSGRVRTAYFASGTQPATPVWEADDE